MRFSMPVIVFVLAGVLFAPLAGCGGQPSAPTSAPSDKLARVDTIIKSSGGDWNKVTPADRDYLINTIGKGSPVAAQMTFQIRAGRMNTTAGIHH